MVYVENWDDFQERSIVLFRTDPVAVSTPALLLLLPHFIVVSCLGFFSVCVVAAL
jgi:hypothetical protein